MSQKIVVFGTGANGSCIAANLVDAGLDVVLIDQWPAHVETMRAQGRPNLRLKKFRSCSAR